MSTEATQAVARQGATVLSCIGSDVWKEEVQKVIPKEIALEAMLRVARSVASDPKFTSVDPKSFLLALLKCGRAGLYPDGREAHLIAFGRDVQVIFDVKGICALAGRAGILVTPKVVFTEDFFEVEEDDGTGKTKVTHRVDYRKPRGEIQAVYSRAAMPDGRVDYEIMSADEVERVRQNFSKAKNSTPWVNSWGEMAKKTAVKRHSKRWDMSPEIRQALNADDDSLPAKDESKVTTPIFSSPASVQEAQEAEIMPEAETRPATAPVASAPPPVVPVPKAPITPKAVKTVTPPVKPPVVPAKAPVKHHMTPLESLNERILSKGVTVEQLLSKLVEMDNIPASVQTLEEVAIQYPDVLDMVYGSLDEMCESILGGSQ